MSKTVWDDEYTGPRWTYGMTYRPASPGFTIPDGAIIQSLRTHPEFRFGTVDYPFELRPETVSAYELIRTEREQTR